jgi:uncharacterized membrane protein
MRGIKLGSLLVMSLFYVFAGINHFRNPDFYLRMMPPYIPMHAEMVFLSGVAELALGVALLIPVLRVYAAWGVIALLIAVFPANVHMALANIPLGDRPTPEWALWARLPFQGLLIAWAWWHTRRESAPAAVASVAAEPDAGVLQLRRR